MPNDKAQFSEECQITKSKCQTKFKAQMSKKSSGGVYLRLGIDRAGTSPAGSEILDPKHEILNKFKAQNTNDQNVCNLDFGQADR